MFWREHARRRAELLEWAAERGWSSRPDGGGAWAKFVTSDHSAKIRPQVWGTWDGREVTVAGHECLGFVDKYAETEYRTVVVVRLRGEHPPVTLTAATRQSRTEPCIDSVFGEFFRVREDPGQAVTPEVMRLTCSELLPPWRVQGGDLIVAWKEEIRGDKISKYIVSAVALADLLDP